MIHLIRTPATPQQIEEMLETLDTYIKLAVDIERCILAGGGVMHADCESALLEDGSAQENIWGATGTLLASRLLSSRSSTSALARLTPQWIFSIHHCVTAWLRSPCNYWSANERLVSYPGTLPS